MSAERHHDPVRRQYATDANIRLRQQIHEQFTHPPIDFAEWVLSNYQWRGGERVLDVGCGNGKYYYPMLYKAPDEGLPIEYHGLDLSRGMLTSHPMYPTSRLTVADLERLPYANGTFDVVMANHVLHHVHNLMHSVQELKRVLKPDGVLITATNSILSMYNLRRILHRSTVLLSRMGSQVQPMLAPSDPYSLENGILVMKRHFYAVMRADLPSTLVFTDAEPLLDYIDSTRDLREPQLPPDVHWDDMMAITRQQIAQIIQTQGHLPIDKLTGVLVCTDSGDFARPFVTLRQKLLAEQDNR